MKLNELISQFTIAVSNEESDLLERIETVMPYHSFTERDRFVIDNLIRKSLLSKIHNRGNTLVVKNDVES